MAEFIQYQDMTLKEIEKSFEKSQAAVGMAVKRMMDRNPDHPEWKYVDEKTKKVMIAAEGVTWLAENYFITPFEVNVVDADKIRLEEQNKYLLEFIEKMGEQYQDKLNLELEKQALKFDSQRLLAEKDMETYKKENERLETALNDARDEAKTNRGVADSYKTKYDESQKEVEFLNNRGFWARVFNKKYEKK